MSTNHMSRRNGVDSCFIKPSILITDNKKRSWKQMKKPQAANSVGILAEIRFKLGRNRSGGKWGGDSVRKE